MIENKKKINRAKIILSSRLATQLERLEIFDSSLEVFDSRGSSCEGRTTHIRVVLYVTDLLYFLQLIKIVKKAANVKKKKKKESPHHDLTVSMTVTLHSESAFVFLILFVCFVFFT